MSTEIKEWIFSSSYPSPRIIRTIAISFDKSTQFSKNKLGTISQNTANEKKNPILNNAAEINAIIRLLKIAVKDQSNNVKLQYKQVVVV